MTLGALAYILLGLIGLISGGEFLVRGAVDLARHLRISPLVIGLTVVAFGTSSPELAVSVRSILSESTGISVGNILGSNIYNILLVLGVAASLTPLTTSNQLIRFDVPVMILASGITILLSLDGVLTRTDGMGLFLSLGAYTLWKLREGRRDHRPDVFQTAKHSHKMVKVSMRTHLGSIAKILIGLGSLIVGAKWLVSGGVSIATALGINELIVGLTVVAIGTSLPELVTSVMSIRKGHREMAVGSVVGSNLFNLLGVLGLTSIIAPSGITIPKEALEFDMLVMFAVAVACFPIFFTGKQISRWEGGLFLFYLIIYTAFLILETLGSHHVRTLAWVMWVFVIPLTVITLSLTAFRGFRSPD